MFSMWKEKRWGEYLKWRFFRVSFVNSVFPYSIHMSAHVYDIQFKINYTKYIYFCIIVYFFCHFKDELILYNINSTQTIFVSVFYQFSDSKHYRFMINDTPMIQFESDSKQQ